MQAALVCQLGVERHRQDVVLAHCHGVALDLGEDLHARPVLVHPGGPDEHGRSAARDRRARAQVASKLCSWRPNALRRALTSSRPRWSRSSMIRPAQVASTGVPAPISSRSGSARPSRSIPSVIVVDSPPGMTSASRPSRSLGRAHLAHLGALLLEDAPVRLEVALESEHADEAACLPTAILQQAAVLLQRRRSRCRAWPRRARARRPPRARDPRSASWPRRSRAPGAPGRTT